MNDPATSSRLPSPLGLAASALLAVLVVAALATYADRWRSLLPFYALPAFTAALSLSVFPDRDLLTWSAPVATVLVGAWLADVLRRWLGPVIDRGPAPDWDELLVAAGRDLGADPALRAVAHDPEPVIDPEPADDHLFL